MRDSHKRLDRLTEALTLVVPYIKFFLLVALEIIILYERNYLLAILVSVLFIVSIVIDFFIHLSFKGNDLFLTNFKIRWAIAIYLTIFGFILTGLPTLITLIKRKSEN